MIQRRLGKSQFEVSALGLGCWAIGGPWTFVDHLAGWGKVEDAYYNWIHPHKSLRLEIKNDPQRKWLPQTPGMAAGLTDHIWTVKELLLVVPVPITTRNTN